MGALADPQPGARWPPSCPRPMAQRALPGAPLGVRRDVPAGGLRAAFGDGGLARGCPPALPQRARRTAPASVPGRARPDGAGHAARGAGAGSERSPAAPAGAGPADGGAGAGATGRAAPHGAPRGARGGAGVRPQTRAGARRTHAAVRGGACAGATGRGARHDAHRSPRAGWHAPPPRRVGRRRLAARIRGARGARPDYGAARGAAPAGHAHGGAGGGGGNHRRGAGRVPAARCDGLGQDGGVPRAGAPHDRGGPGRDRARTGDLVDTAGDPPLRRTVPGGDGGPALRPQHGRAVRPVAPHPTGEGAGGGGVEERGLRPRPEPRPRGARRGARVDLQAGRPAASLPRPRCRRGALPPDGGDARAGQRNA